MNIFSKLIHFFTYAKEVWGCPICSHISESYVQRKLLNKDGNKVFLVCTKCGYVMECDTYKPKNYRRRHYKHVKAN